MISNGDKLRYSKLKSERIDWCWYIDCKLTIGIHSLEIYLAELIQSGLSSIRLSLLIVNTCAMSSLLTQPGWQRLLHTFTSANCSIPIHLKSDNHARKVYFADHLITIFKPRLSLLLLILPSWWFAPGNETAHDLRNWDHWSVASFIKPQHWQLVQAYYMHSL